MPSGEIQPARVGYAEALQRQAELVARRQRGELPDLVWYVEHPPVVTWTRGRGRRHLRVEESELRRREVTLHETDRGGDVTYHGPGQLVGYPVIDLDRPGPVFRDLHAYMRQIEEALMAALRGWGLAGRRVPGRTGVWVDDPAGGGMPVKIAAIGVRCRRWVTSHGFALNVGGDLDAFRELIVPCGIADAGVTSLAEVLGERAPGLPAALSVVHTELAASLDRPLALSLDGIEVSTSLR